MDFNQRDYFFQMQQMRQMPYSWMYPYQDLYMSEMETERDLQYLQQMYPADAKRMQKKVEEACDRLDYEGSMMYDEYPDRVSMLLMCDRIAEELRREDAEKQALDEARAPEEEMAEEPMQAMHAGRPGPPPPPPFDPGRRSLLEVLLYNEMYKRRCRRRQCRRFW